MYHTPLQRGPCWQCLSASEGFGAADVCTQIISSHISVTVARWESTAGVYMCRSHRKWTVPAQTRTGYDYSTKSSQATGDSCEYQSHALRVQQRTCTLCLVSILGIYYKGLNQTQFFFFICHIVVCLVFTALNNRVGLGDMTIKTES